MEGMRKTGTENGMKRILVIGAFALLLTALAAPGPAADALANVAVEGEATVVLDR